MDGSFRSEGRLHAAAARHGHSLPDGTDTAACHRSERIEGSEGDEGFEGMKVAIGAVRLALQTKARYIST
ncbi:hypothetical protein [Streptosporangium roseum]|uniref:hypothetical protein n=1 Tax=Streptosporangium roseum TaxID=2001 RepID=UPI00031F57BF|nr:hypothetical protein [Streptosporangium roseum]